MSAKASITALVFLAVAMSPAWGDPAVYEQGFDPGVGFNLVSWYNFGAGGATVWQNAVQDLYDHGFRHVSICPVRFFDTGTGAIFSSHAKGPELSHIAAAVARADALGMTVTLNPFVEPDNFAFWRGTWNPSGAVAAEFWSDYGDYVADVAAVGQTNGAERLTVGTELKAITANSAHNADLTAVINRADAAFSGSLGYAANWDEYNNANLTTTVWEHPAIDWIGIDAYFPLATNAQADASGAHPDAAFISTIHAKWDNLLDNTLLPFADARKAGSGMPVIFTEQGLIPYNRTTVTPYSENPGYAQPVDQGEQINGFHGLIDAADGRAADGDLLEMYLWHWGMPGAYDSFWFLNPDPDSDVPGSKYDESLSVPCAEYLGAYVNTPEPASLALLAFGVLTLLRGGAVHRTAGGRPSRPGTRTRR